MYAGLAVSLPPRGMRFFGCRVGNGYQLLERGRPSKRAYAGPGCFMSHGQHCWSAKRAWIPYCDPHIESHVHPWLIWPYYP